MFDCQSLRVRINLKSCIYVLCLLLPLLLSPLAASTYKESRCGYVVLLVALYWFLEPVPVAATALIPVILFPLLGVVSSNEICSNYMKEIFMLFIGGLIVAIAIEECNLHERIALKILLWIGTEIKWLMMGFMVTTMFLSMWLSNTATTAMMVPIVEAVIGKISLTDQIATDMEMEVKDDSQTKSKQTDDSEAASNSPKTISKTAPETTSNMRVGLLLSICYAANIGGTGTLTGTGANLVLKGLMEELFPESGQITFATWMMYNVPGMIFCLLVGWFYLWMIYIRCSKKNQNLESKESIKEIISKKYAALGSISAHELQVSILFFILVLCWIFRDPKFITGWGEMLGSAKKIGNSVPAIAVSFLMFFLPANPRDLGGRRILDWKTVQTKLPWGVIILIGGGFALADAAQKSGLSVLLGEKLSVLNALSPAGICAVIAFTTAMVTEIITNTAAANIILPVVGQMAVSIGVNPLYLMLPVTVVCSYAFMLPVATPPNAIAFESGGMTTLDMAKPGLVMNLVCCAVQLFMINTLGVVLFDLHTFPTWANSPNSSTFNNASDIFNANSFESYATLTSLQLTNGT